MCHLTGFVLVNAMSNTTTYMILLACLLTQEVLLKVGFCNLIVVDDSSTFKGTNFQDGLLPP
jgi:hypothetical protein